METKSFLGHTYKFSPLAFTAIVIQGPLAPITIDLAKRYLENGFSRVIVSGWSDHTYPEFTQAHMNTLVALTTVYKNLHLVVEPMPSTEGIHNDRYVYYQIVSTLNGIQALDQVSEWMEYPPIILKVRSNYPFFMASYLAEVAYKNRDKLTTSNAFALHPSYIPYHPSDHLMGSSSHNMKGMFKAARDMCETNSFVEGVQVAAESILGTAFLRQKGIEPKPDIDTAKRLMKEHFMIVPNKYVSTEDYSIERLNAGYPGRILETIDNIN